MFTFGGITNRSAGSNSVEVGTNNSLGINTTQTPIDSASVTLGIGTAPTLTGGGPADAQNFVPLEASIDINLASGSFITTGPAAPNTTNVTLYLCTGATDAASCTTPDTSSNRCASVAIGNASSGGSDNRITCTATLTASTTYKFTVNGRVTNSSNVALGSSVSRIFRTSSFSAANNTTVPRIVQSYPTPGQTGVPGNAKLSLEFPIGPEGVMKTGAETTGSVTNNANFTLQALVNGSPSGTDLCGSGCTLTWNATTRVLLIDPTDLTSGTEYELNVTGLQNDSSVSILPYIVRFAAGASDSTPPTVKMTCGAGATEACTTPVNAATGISRYTGEFRIQFSEALDQTALTLGTNVGLYLDADSSSTKNGAEAILGSSALAMTYDAPAKEIKFFSSDALSASSVYCFYALGGAGGVKDAGGNLLATTSQDKCFTTGSDSDGTAPTLDFVDADNFKIVAHFSEPLKPADAATIGNYTLECPTGTPVSLTGNTVTVTYRPEFREVEIQGLGLQTDASCTLTVAAATTFRDIGGLDASSALTASFEVQNSATTGGMLGASGATDFSSTNFGTFWENPQRCQPRNSATNKATSLECEFPVTEALATGSTFSLTFPSGFTFSTADGNTRAIPVSSSGFNGDINGPAANAPQIASVTCTANNLTCVVTTGSAPIAANDQIHFELDRITTPTTSGTDLRISVVMKNSSDVKVGQTIQAAPFSINQAGSLSISGKVCKGTSSGGSCGDSDTGIANVKVVCDQRGGFTVGSTAGGMMGTQEATTAENGTWSISGLSSGEYNCYIPPDPTGLENLGGSSSSQTVQLASANKTGLDFKYTDLSATGKTLTITIAGPNDADSDADDFGIFCHAGFTSNENSAPIMKSGDWATSGNTTVTMKLQGGKTYECGMGPYMKKESFSTGGPPPIPEFDFMPPTPLQVVVPTGSNPSDITFNLTTASLTITGTVQDGSSAGIANAYVHANPVRCFDATSGAAKSCFGSFAQSKSDGTFTLKVGPGTYEINAGGPGLPQSSSAIATVTGSTSVSGVTLKIAKSSTTISGQIFDDSGNGIKYAHVNGQKITSNGTCASFTPAGGMTDSPTDESGNYTLYAAAGTWCIRAFAPTYGEVGTKTVVVSGSTSQTGQNIQPTASDYGTLSGTVTQAGTAVSGGFLNCYRTAGGNGTGISNGTYSMKLKAGTYTCDGVIPGVGPLTRDTNVVVTGNSTTTKNFTVGNPGTITVTIAGITDAFCDARDASGFGSSGGRANENGVYTINVQAGTYTVRCMGPKYGELVNQTNVVVTAGGTATVTGTAPTTRTVAGRVTDGSSNLSGVTLKFTEKSTGRSFTKATGSQGSSNNNLSESGIPEGSYNVTASKQGYGSATTTASVSGGNLTFSDPIALTAASGSTGGNATVNVQASGSAYAGSATVIATSGSKTITGTIDENTGAATLALTNGTWTVKAIGDNGKESATSTVTMTGGAQSGSAPTLSLATDITGYTSANESETIALSSGGLLKFEGLTVGGVAPEVNIPASTLSTSDSSTGKVDMQTDPTIAIDPGEDENFVGTNGYEITPKDANGNEIPDINGTVTITIPYTDAQVASAGVAEEDMKLASYDQASQSWESHPTTVDMTNNLLIASVSHFSSFGIIGPTSGGSLTSSDVVAPGAPTNITSSATTGSVTLTWTDPTDGDLTEIEVLRNTPPSSAVAGTALTRVAKGVQKFVDTAVSAATEYFYILRAKDSSGNTRNSDMVTIKTTTTASSTPTSGATTAAPASGSGTTTAAPATTTTSTTTTATPGATSIGLNAGDLVKGTVFKTVYLVGADGKRYVYPNEVTYKSWHSDFSKVKTLSDADLASLQLGGFVTVRPGTWLVKIESDPKVYAVETGGTLRWVETEARAMKLYGASWSKKIVDVPVSFWVGYKAGTALGADAHPTGTLVRSGSTVYYVDGGMKRLVTSDVLTALGLQDRFVNNLDSSIVYGNGPTLTASPTLTFAGR
ncbi:MAG: Ig-like domain-containing protein [bacterium]|nr:Ig-like domain-containing protein [bacterium]